MKASGTAGGFQPMAQAKGQLPLLPCGAWLAAGCLKPMKARVAALASGRQAASAVLGFAWLALLAVPAAEPMALKLKTKILRRL